MSHRVPVVGADFHVDGRVLLAMSGLFFVEVEHDNLHVLKRHRVGDQTDGILLVSPVLAREVIENNTGVAVFLLDAQLDHSNQEVSGEQLVLSVVDLGFDLTLLGFLSLLLGFQGSDRGLELRLLLFKELSGLFRDSVAALVPVVDQLVEPDHAALVLLSHVVGHGGPANTVGSNQNQVQLVVFLDRWGQLDLEVVRGNLLQLVLELALLVGHLVAELGDLLLSPLGGARRLGTCWLLFEGFVGGMLCDSLLFSD